MLEIMQLMKIVEVRIINLLKSRSITYQIIYRNLIVKIIKDYTLQPLLNKSQITLEQNKLTPKWKQTDPNKYNRDSNQSVNVERKVPPIEKYNTNESNQKLLNTNELKIDHVNQRVSYAMPY